jgi:ADP-heptose:LPS heptosyltransferase
MSDGVVQKTMGLFGANCLTVEQDFQGLPNRYNNHNLDGKKLLVIREGGAGDLLFNTPVFKYLKEKYPTCEIGLACMPVYSSLFNNHPHIDKVYPHVMSYEEFQIYDYFATFEGIIETNIDAQFINAYDLFIERYGISLTEIPDKTPIISVSDRTKEFWISVLGHRLGQKNIGIQLRASSPVRTIPLEMNAEIIRKLINSGYTVFLLDSLSRKQDIANFIASFQLYEAVDASKYSDNFERLAGIISLMDLFVGPDSSGTHIAAALDKPIVGLYGPFRSHLRLKYYKKAVGIDAQAQRCNSGRGCYQHEYSLCNFAIELGIDQAPCWSLLNTDIVVQQVEKLWNKVYTKDKELVNAS